MRSNNKALAALIAAAFSAMAAIAEAVCFTVLPILPPMMR